MALFAEIVRACLVANGVVVAPPVPNETVPYQQTPYDGSILCYAPSMPDEIDQAVCIYDTQGRVFGYSQRKVSANGPKRLSHPGIKAVIRALDETGSDVATRIANALDSIYNQTVTVRGANYSVQSVYCIGEVIGLGEERGRKRQLWVVNARVAMQS
jgi:hypothetical protein